MLRLWAIAATFALIGAGRAAADPCEAIPPGGPAPAAASFGAAFSGPVAHVIDGDSFCVALGEGPQAWLEVRLGDFYAVKDGAAGAKAKAALEGLALGKPVDCVANLQSDDRIAARCWIGGQLVSDSLRAAGVAEEDVGSVAAPARAARRASGGSGGGSQGSSTAQTVGQGSEAFGRSVASALKQPRPIPILILP